MGSVMKGLPESRYLDAEEIDEDEKLRRWAAVQSRTDPPTLIVLVTESQQRFVFEGWLLGYGAEGAGEDDAGHQWQRKEATIYLTAGGRIVCRFLWIAPGQRHGGTYCMEFDNDYALLCPRFGSYRVEADKCVQIAARKAAKKCQVFGLFGVKWIDADGDLANTDRRRGTAGSPAGSLLRESRGAGVAFDVSEPDAARVNGQHSGHESPAPDQRVPGVDAGSAYRRIRRDR